MKNKHHIRVLHIDSEMSWRGGQQQVAYLLGGMHRLGFKTALACKPDAELESYCRSNGLPCLPVAMHGELDILAGYKIARLCKKHGYRIAHLHSAHALATGLWAKMFHRKLRLVAVRRVTPSSKKSRLSWIKYKTRQVDKIVCISEAIRNVMSAGGVHESRLATIYSGIDPGRFDNIEPPSDFRQQLGIPPDHVLVGTVAAMTKEKDYPTLLHAARKAIDLSNHVSFCAVGNGRDEKDIHALSRQLGLGDRFVFAGFRNDVGNFLKTFDIFVLPSNQEGLGTSILDAQTVGLPVVACRTGGIPEIVHDHVNGLLVPTRGPGAMAEAILKLADSEEMRRDLGRRARETAAAFSIHRTVQKNIALYRELLGELPV
jgi:glycosyltransferase involved in cell wall biosynthesis